MPQFQDLPLPRWQLLERRVQRASLFDDDGVIFRGQAGGWKFCCVIEPARTR
jgi:hypothetical protein